MNQVFYLVEELRKVKQLSEQLGGVESIVGWKKHLDSNNNLVVRQHVNVLENISLSLYESLRVEAEINGHEIYDQTWIQEVLDALSLKGMFPSNVSKVSNQTLEYLRMTARTWQLGFEVKSSLDEVKVSHLITALEEERAEIIKDDKLSFDLKRILVIELDRLIWALKKYSKVGDVLQGALKDIYGEILLNPDVQNEFIGRSKLKDTITEISSYVTIGTAAYQYLPAVTQKAAEFLKLMTGNN
ncbi:hypothetical protein [Acinetobacter guillouiae]|uniref:hypothetical protein n=1 Tax=Acinetobacter guillouiae TaxID=106649 RepID=UPI0004EF6210|nr:hypothetical protein [Acinetobacter guillouiae]MBP2546003.1 hypothetical protein [Acinetobacter guillouiae]BAP35423.1 hypothetical protein AS4_04830 [Acinetobacter guillouiae]